MIYLFVHSLHPATAAACVPLDLDSNDMDFIGDSETANSISAYITKYH